MKNIEVVAAIICRSGEIFATQRGYGEWKDWWEFPGGKVEPSFHLTMHCYICSVISGHLMLREHEDARWLPVGEIDSVKWMPADITVINLLKKTINPPAQFTRCR